MKQQVFFFLCSVSALETTETGLLKVALRVANVMTNSITFPTSSAAGLYNINNM